MYLIEPCKVIRIIIFQEGKKPVDVAAENGRADIVSLLTKWAALRKVTTIDRPVDKNT